MLSFYFDKQVSEPMASALVILAYDVTTANRMGNKGLHDGLQLLIAANSGRVLVTYNAADFKLLHRSWRDWSRGWNEAEIARHAGIMLIYSHKGFGARALAQVIDGSAQQHNDLTSRLVAWNAAVGWHNLD